MQTGKTSRSIVIDGDKKPKTWYARCPGLPCAGKYEYYDICQECEKITCICNKQ